MKAQAENQGTNFLQQQEIKAQMTVKENEHKLCKFEEIPDEFDCHNLRLIRLIILHVVQLPVKMGVYEEDAASVTQNGDLSLLTSK